MAASTRAKGYGRLTRKLFLSAILALVILSILNAGSLVAAQSDDDDEYDSESFLDHDEMEPDPTPVTHAVLPPSIPSPQPSPASVPDVPPAPAAPAPAAPSPPPPPPPSPQPTTPQSPKPLPTNPSGILKPGTPSPDCAIFGELYKATGPWQFVPDTANCCNAEYPNSSGVKCNAAGQIIYIYLAGQGLSGSLPDSLGSLTALQYLLLYYNNLSGPIPQGVANLPLLILDLSHNRLSGPLPSSAPGWTNIGTLNLEQNALTGPLPDWLSTLPNLHSLALGQNQFTTGDPVPAFSFNLEPPPMSGTGASTPAAQASIPANVTPANYVPPSSVFLEAFTRLPKLKQLKLDSLGISGGFPASWQQKMVNLTKLDLSNNTMQGPIPSYLNGFPGMKTLLLDRNEFGGTIPDLSGLRSLTVLDMSYNQLSGPIPPWGAGLNLTVLNFSNNLLSGPLPLDNHHTWKTCSVANNYFVCTKGPEQILSAKWKSDCRATCADTQQTVPVVRPPVNTTLPGIRVRQTHNEAIQPVVAFDSIQGWITLGMTILSVVSAFAAY
ncbi:hypothetical protein EMPS_02807 [Entomortierella parvispora]|uniref:L domain-like protein n=1 Tax=Entomortierella parvispora TaxID=205924 RepID=A0A9P3H5K7_9FUNG|nr:hypothetical protein EMPS_02807 [Entomortierella parvispora]